eukprot:SAG31_NODE_25687_length_456_cov_1.154062_1_plen_59_part_10
MAVINQLKKENVGLQKYALGLENALRAAGVDPSSVEGASAAEVRAVAGSGASAEVTAGL